MYICFNYRLHILLPVSVIFNHLRIIQEVTEKYISIHFVVNVPGMIELSNQI